VFGKIKLGRARPRPAPRVQARRDAGGADDRLLDARWLHGGVTLDAAGRGETIRIESDAVINYCFPKTSPADREVRASIIGDWLQD